MIAVDTQILVYSQREDSPWNAGALACLRSLAEGDSPWAIPWPCIHEFLAVVTHPRIYRPPTPMSDALQQVDYWVESPSLRLIGEAASYWDHLKATVSRGQGVGPLVHDARLAAICQTHGVREFWSTDRDFSRFPSLAVRNPLVES